MATLVQVIFPSRTGFPEDQVVNTFHFLKSQMTDPEVQACALVLNDFYNELSGVQVTSLAARMSAVIDRVTPTQLKYFDTTVAGVPNYNSRTLQIDDAIPGSEALPAEVAVCLSYRQNGAAGVQARRQRGRIYLGPLVQAARATDGIGRAIVASAYRTDILEAGKALHDAADAATWGPWVVHSTAQSTPGSNPPDLQTDYPIDYIAVDDAFDTQRRRGEQATLREIVNF